MLGFRIVPIVSYHLGRDLLRGFIMLLRFFVLRVNLSQSALRLLDPPVGEPGIIGPPAVLAEFLVEIDCSFEQIFSCSAGIWNFFQVTVEIEREMVRGIASRRERILREGLLLVELPPVHNDGCQKYYHHSCNAPHPQQHPAGTLGGFQKVPFRCVQRVAFSPAFCLPKGLPSQQTVRRALVILVPLFRLLLERTQIAVPPLFIAGQQGLDQAVVSQFQEVSIGTGFGAHNVCFLQFLGNPIPQSFGSEHLSTNSLVRDQSPLKPITQIALRDVGAGAVRNCGHILYGVGVKIGQRTVNFAEGILCVDRIFGRRIFVRSISLRLNISQPNLLWVLRQITPDAVANHLELDRLDKVSLGCAFAAVG